MSISMVPKFAFFVSGVGMHEDRLQAFEKALLAAGPFAHNLVTVSSIMPAGCEIITPEEGFAKLIAGEITFCIMARQDTDKPLEHASAAVGIVKVKDTTKFGYISEYHGAAAGTDEAEKIAQRLAVEMYEAKTGTLIKNLAMDRVQAAAASIQHPEEECWVSAVSLCVFVL